MISRQGIANRQLDMNKNNSLEVENASNHSIARQIRRLSNKERLKTFLSLFKREDRVMIVIVADPDSMASAFAVKRLLSRRVSEIIIVHPNKIKRLNNIAMRDLLKIPMQPLRGSKRDEFTKFVLLDSQPTHRKEFANIKFDAVIDHHPLTEGWSAPFIDVREEYGAACTMLAEYLKAAKIKPSTALATAMFYGIKVDTHNFTKKATPADVLCFQTLFKKINKYWLNKIEQSDIRKAELKYFREAFQNLKVRKNRIYCHLGKIGNPDILVVIADFLTHVHDIGWVIISGQAGEKLVVIFRCDGYKKNAGRLAQRVLGKFGSAGGHKESARAEIPIKNLPEKFSKDLDTNKLMKLFMKHLD